MVKMLKSRLISRIPTELLGSLVVLECQVVTLETTLVTVTLITLKPQGANSEFISRFVNLAAAESDS